MAHILPANSIVRKTATAASIIAGLGGNQSTGMCFCPAHDNRETEALHVGTGRNGDPVFKCHGGCSQNAVIEVLRKRQLWGGGSGNVVSLAEQRRERWERREREQQEEQDLLDRKWAIHNQATAIRSEAAQALLQGYFMGRGIHSVPENASYLAPEAVRNLDHAHPKLGLGPAARENAPAMVFPIRRGGKLIGWHLTMLSRDGRGKLKLDNGDARRICGSVKGGYVQLGRWDPRQVLERLIIGEGVENALAAAQLCATRPLKADLPHLLRLEIPAIAAINANNLAVVEPPAARETIICADNDPGGLGLEKAKWLAGGLNGPGRTVRIAVPDSKDWNEVLLKVGRDTGLRAHYRERILEAETVTGPPEAKPVTMSELREMEAPPIEYMLKPWLHVGALAMLHARTGHGKTHVAMAAGYAMASGSGVMGWEVGGAARRVLYVDGELPTDLVKERVAALGADCDNFLVLSKFILADQNTPMRSLGDEEGRKWLDGIIEKWRADCIILDSLSTLFGTSMIENEAECWGPVQDWMMAHRSRRRSILLLHHEGKGTGTQRGHTKREDTMDSILRLKENVDKSTETVSAFELSFPKHRRFHGADAKPRLLRLDISSVTAAWTQEPLEDHGEQVAQMLANGVKQKEIARVLGISESQVTKLKQRAAAHGLDAIRRRANGHDPRAPFDEGGG
jgi:hypothetical protein